jgi:hypothetical protein
MPYPYEIDTRRRVIITRAVDALTADDIRETRGILLADPGFDAGYNQLIDLRNMTDTALEFVDLANIAGNSVFRPGVRRAIVSTSPLQYGIARMFELLSDRHGQHVKVFRTLAEADEWLDAPADLTGP